MTDSAADQTQARIIEVAKRLSSSFLPGDNVQNLLHNLQDVFDRLKFAVASYDRISRTKFFKAESDRLSPVPVLSFDASPDGRSVVKTELDLHDLDEAGQQEVLRHLLDISRVRVHGAAYVLGTELTRLIDAIESGILRQKPS